MSDNTRQDDELAALTDSLLAGDEIRVPEDLRDLAEVVQLLHRTVAPAAPPGRAFRTHLTQRLIREWNRVHQRRAPWWRQRRVIQFAALAAGIALTLLAVVLVSVRGEGSSDTLQGTASGPFAWAFVIVVALVGAVLAVIWFRQRR